MTGAADLITADPLHFHPYPLPLSIRCKRDWDTLIRGKKGLIPSLLGGQDQSSDFPYTIYKMAQKISFLPNSLQVEDRIA